MAESPMEAGKRACTLLQQRWAASATGLELLIEHDPKATGGFFLNSYHTTDGRWLGDTWHLTLEDAKRQPE
jgi:hypothetical protein